MEEAEQVKADDKTAVASPSAEAEEEAAGPSDEQIKEAVQDIVKDVDVNTFNMKALLAGLAAKFPGIALSSARKKSIKALVVEVLSLRSEAVPPTASAASLESAPEATPAAAPAEPTAELSASEAAPALVHEAAAAVDDPINSLASASVLPTGTVGDVDEDFFA